MPRRKKEEAGQQSPAKSPRGRQGSKAGKRVGLKIRLVRPEPAAISRPAEPEAVLPAAPIEPEIVAKAEPIQPAAAESIPPVTPAEPPVPVAAAPVAPVQPKTLASEQERRLIMWTVVSFLMIMVAGWWVFNLRLTFETHAPSMANGEMDLDKISQDMDKTMLEVSRSLDELAASSASSSATTTEQLASSSGRDLTVPAPSATSSAEQAAIIEAVRQLEASANQGPASTTGY